jgi:threonine aldolase
VTVRTVPQPDGRLDLERYAALCRSASLLGQATRLLWVEQPTRGWIVPLTDLAGLRALADETGVPVHMDGARIFNAAVALGVPAATVAEYADSVMFCVSKGLGAPVGSLLVGSRAFIGQARLDRQMLGGGLRQAGIIAAGGLYALANHVARLADDHANAQRLAAGLAALRGLRVDRDRVETNIFFLAVDRPDIDVASFAAELARRDVLVNPPSRGRRTVRFVTHLGVERTDIETALAVAADVAGAASAQEPIVAAPSGGVASRHPGS